MPIDADPLSDRIDEALEAAWSGTTDGLESLLDEQLPDDPAHEVIDQLGAMAGQGMAPAIPDIPGYQILRELGRGAMGIVYEAHYQGDTVALKVMRRHVATDSFHARLFCREAAALQVLDHANIARIRDVGRTGDDICYLSMDLVDGVRLNEFARRHRDDPPMLLGVFLAICKAVQAAHQKGIVHRDLKPSNVLVTEHGRPYLIDFGLARVTGLASGATQTIAATGRLIGTLPYMSPEQLKGSPRDVDVRSDVYALGVMLYEMLSGTLPHDVSSCSLHAAIETICNSMPRRLRDVAPGLPADYEIVVATAMAHDVQQRYQGAADLHDDVQRLLQREPIRARRPSMWYQLRRLVRRHRLASALIGAICLGLIIFTSVVTVQAFSLAQQRDQIQLELERANIEAEKANSVKIFMEQMFVAADPTFGKTDVTVLQALEQANALLEQDHDNHPQVRAAVRVSIAELLTGLGEYDKSTPMFEQAVSILREAQPVPAIDLAVALRFLAGNRFDTSRYDEAVPLLLESIGLFQQAGAASSPEGMRTRNDLGIIYHLRGDLDDAQHHYNLALQGRLAQDDVSPAAVAQSRHNLGSVLLDLERYDEAQVQLQAAIEYGQAHRPDSMSLSQSQKALGQVFLRTDRIAEALALFEANLAMCQRVLGDDHPQTILIRHHVAMGLRAAGQLDAAEATLDQVIAQSEARLGPDHLFTALARLTQAGCHFDQGRIEASRTLLDQVEPVLSAHYNPTHPNRVDAATLRAALHAH